MARSRMNLQGTNDWPLSKKMKSIELQKFIQNISAELYSFAFILIPDDLQASQLMIDSVSVFLIQNKPLVDLWKKSSDVDLVQHSENVKRHLYKAMYELSKKRYNQLRLSFKNMEDSSGFFSLNFDDKAALFLQERTDFPLELIQFILDKTEGEILAHLYSARIFMVNFKNHVSNHNEGLGIG